ncbi:hypothetical protein AQUCO_03600072v1 [Aquilegia coerulea]|uniref:Uncharacterized protein n=1 Tax=Aquilegia coerulea TaxID=218851 RepID=A0A2G5CV78_AQUCA|nr:hypothetical protein AQUCO_03600072v1 [Aquilegia coerulea]
MECVNCELEMGQIFSSSTVQIRKFIPNSIRAIYAIIQYTVQIKSTIVMMMIDDSLYSTVHTATQVINPLLLKDACHTCCLKRRKQFSIIITIK